MHWRAALTAALGMNGALMVTLLPELGHVIGPQPPVAELSPRDAQRRFQLVFRHLLALIGFSHLRIPGHLFFAVRI